MENITYVTGNYGKYYSVSQKAQKAGIPMDYYRYDFEEPEIDDIQFISKEKAIQAYNLLHSPVFVADSGFYIEDYPGKSYYPGALVKRSGIASNVSKLLETMKQVQNRHCYFVDCLTFYDGNDTYQFFGVSRGTLSYEIRGNLDVTAKSNLWAVFIPQNCTKTLAEMTEEERNHRPDGRTSAIDSFLLWYQFIYKKQKVKRKKF